MATTTNRLATFADLEQVYTQDRRYELRHGELVEVPPAIHEHLLIQRRLRRLLQVAAGHAGEAEIEVGFRELPEHEYRVADVVFVSRERWDRIPPKGNLQGAPDIVIEVLSPSNTAAEMLDKKQLCLENGAKEFWVVDPRRNQVEVSTTDGRAVIYKSGQQIPLYFGGAIAVDEIFAN